LVEDVSHIVKNVLENRLKIEIIDVVPHK